MRSVRASRCSRRGRWTACLSGNEPTIGAGPLAVPVATALREVKGLTARADPADLAADGLESRRASRA
jgi:hypothetical protein